MNYILFDTRKGFVYKGTITKEEISFEDIEKDILSKQPNGFVHLYEPDCMYMTSETDIPVFDVNKRLYILLGLYKKLGTKHNDIFELIRLVYQKFNIRFHIDGDCGIYHDNGDDKVFICNSLPFYEKSNNLELEKYILNLIQNLENEKDN